MSQYVFDQKAVSQLEIMYRTRDVLRRRRLVREALAARAGERVLDLGCGPGFYTAELLAEVGTHGTVVGVDTSAPMLEAAASRCEGLGGASFLQGSATALDLEDSSFDRALCVQVLEHVGNVPAALAELHRVLRPGGRVLIWDVDWSTLSWYSTDPERMQRMCRAWDLHLAHPSLPSSLASALRATGFGEIRAEGHAFVTTELDFETYGGNVLQRVEHYLAGRDDIDQSDVAAWAEEQHELGAQGRFFFAIIQFCFTALRTH